MIYDAADRTARDVKHLGKLSLLDAYRGNGGGSLHITQALAGMVGAATVGGGVAIIGAAALYWQAKLLLMFVFGPFTLLMAALWDLDQSADRALG